MVKHVWTWRKIFTFEMVRIVHNQFLLKGGFKSCLRKSKIAVEVFRHIDWALVAQLLAKNIMKTIPTFSSRLPSALQCRDKWRAQFRFAVIGYNRGTVQYDVSVAVAAFFEENGYIAANIEFNNHSSNPCPSSAPHSAHVTTVAPITTPSPPPNPPASTTFSMLFISKIRSICRRIKFSQNSFVSSNNDDYAKIQQDLLWRDLQQFIFEFWSLHSSSNCDDDNDRSNMIMFDPAITPAITSFSSSSSNDLPTLNMLTCSDEESFSSDSSTVKSLSSEGDYDYVESTIFSSAPNTKKRRRTEESHFFDHSSTTDENGDFDGLTRTPAPSPNFENPNCDKSCVYLSTHPLDNSLVMAKIPFRLIIDSIVLQNLGIQSKHLLSRCIPRYIYEQFDDVRLIEDMSMLNKLKSSLPWNEFEGFVFLQIKLGSSQLKECSGYVPAFVSSVIEQCTM